MRGKWCRREQERSKGVVGATFLLDVSLLTLFATTRRFGKNYEVVLIFNCCAFSLTGFTKRRRYCTALRCRWLWIYGTAMIFHCAALPQFLHIRARDDIPLHCAVTFCTHRAAIIWLILIHRHSTDIDIPLRDVVADSALTRQWWYFTALRCRWLCRYGRQCYFTGRWYPIMQRIRWHCTDGTQMKFHLTAMSLAPHSPNSRGKDDIPLRCLVTDSGSRSNDDTPLCCVVADFVHTGRKWNFTALRCQWVWIHWVAMKFHCTASSASYRFRWFLAHRAVITFYSLGLDSRGGYDIPSRFVFTFFTLTGRRLFSTALR